MLTQAQPDHMIALARQLKALRLGVDELEAWYEDELTKQFYYHSPSLSLPWPLMDASR